MRDDGNTTPISPEELDDLIPNLATKEELNEWERENILEARRWALKNQQLKKNDPLSEEYIRRLHKKMFDQTWRWAGKYRKTEKNLGVPVHQIQELIGNLIGDAKYWADHKTYDVDELAVRFHHRLVVIHPFPNGNGRHARLIADVIAVKMGRPPFTWGSADVIASGEARKRYLESLRSADNSDIKPLLKFARS